MALRLHVSSRLSQRETNTYQSLCDLQRVTPKVNRKQEEFMFCCSSSSRGGRSLGCKSVCVQQVNSPFGVCVWQLEPLRAAPLEFIIRMF